MKLSLGYKDVNLIAQSSTVKSRLDIPVDGWRIFVSPMPSIIGVDFIRAVADLPTDWRPSLCLPKIENQEELVDSAQANGLENVWVSIGLDTDYKRLCQGYNGILLDTANGNLEIVKRKVKEIKDNYYDVIAGNVHSFEAAKDLRIAGADFIRVGIGGGSVCSTTYATGYGRGAITELDDTNAWLYDLIADGGILSPGDIVKAFGAGASAIMAGRIFAACAEAENVVSGEYKYWGLATMLQKGTDYFIEGRSINIVEEITPLKDILYILWDGIRSGISYSGYDEVDDFIGNGVFERAIR